MKSEKIALFQVFCGSLALNAACIEAVVEASRIYHLPQLPVGFSGISLDQGRVIPVLDETQLPGVGLGVNDYLVLCRSEYGLVGLPVCEVGQIVENHEGIEELTGDSEQPGSIGFFLHREERYPMLDVDQLLGSLN